jgi:hypothetical protein
MWIRNLTALVVLAATTGASGWSFPPPDEVPDPDDYRIHVVEDWTVHVNKQLLSFHSRLTLDAMNVLQAQLGRVVQALPVNTLGRLRQVPIWLELSVKSKITNAAAFYRSLRRGGADDGRSYPTEGSVVIRKAQLFAYHDQVLGLDHAGISRHYLEAKKSGRYENVPTVYGRRLPAYAMASE